MRQKKFFLPLLTLLIIILGVGGVTASDQMIPEDDPLPPGAELPNFVEMKDAEGTSSKTSREWPSGKGETGELHWKSGSVSLEPGIEPELLDLQKEAGVSGSSESGYTYVVVQYLWNPTKEELAQITEWGYKEIDYIPDYAYIVRVPVDKLLQVSEQPFVRVVASLRPEWKLLPALAATIDSASGEKFAIRLVAFEPLELSGDSPLVREGSSLNYNGELSVEQILTLLENPLVKWIEPFTQNQILLDTSINVVAANRSRSSFRQRRPHFNKNKWRKNRRAR